MYAAPGGLVTALSRLDALLRDRVAGMPERPDAFRGLVITPEEALYLALAPGLQHTQLHEPRDLQVGAASGTALTDDPMTRMAEAFGLSPLDVDLLVLAVAPDLDLRYQKLFGFLQDDVTRTRPTVGFALDLLLGSDLARLSQLHRVTEDSPAVAEGLLRVVADGRDSNPPLAGHVLVADPQVLRWLTGAPEPDPRVRAVAPQPASSMVEVADTALAQCSDPAQGLAAARREARFRGLELRLPAGAALDLATGVAAGRASVLGHPIDTSVGWADLILPERDTAALHELCARVRHRGRVLDEWGFARGLLGRGVLGLFAGPPGTGKTLAARVVAAELDLPLFRVDIGQVVSKYIGETEKNLARVFSSAAGTGAVLLFDEADALFGKRTAVRDSHDRYANQEVAYLLARVEEYDGLALLTTNLSDNIDAAFLRRVTTVLSFPLPDPAARRRMWQQVWPSPEVLHPEVDLDAIAQNRLSGAGIRDAALTAAFLAAADGTAVRLSHLETAVLRELTKAGRVHTPTLSREEGP